MSVSAVDQGLPLLEVKDLLAANQDLISRIKLAHGSSSQTFESQVLDPIRRYVTFVNALPATADNFFCEPGGLVRLGLEVAFLCLQGADGYIISPRATITAREHLEPRWKLAALLAGLCAELHRSLSQLVVTNEAGDQWSPYLGPLTTWLQESNSQRFFVRWLLNHQEIRALGLFALPYIIEPKMMGYLGQGNTIAVPQMLSCISGQPLLRDQNIMADLLRKASALIINRNLLASARRYGRPIHGAHIERYLIDSMRRLLVQKPSWSPNTPRSRVWLSEEGLFLVWPGAATDIHGLLESDAIPGIPKSPDTILDILAAAGVITAREDGSRMWQIYPPPGFNQVEAVKLSAPAIIFGESHSLPQAVSALLTQPAPNQAKQTEAASSDALAASPTGASRARNVTSSPAPNHGAGKTSTSQGTPTSPPVPSVPQSQHVATTASEPQNMTLELFPIESVQSPASTAAHDTQATDTPAGPHGEHAHAHTPGSSASTALPFRFVSPARLHPQVKDAAVDLIATLNGPAAQSQAITVRNGVFVPLTGFTSKGLDAPLVIRSFKDLGMLALAEGEPLTQTHTFHGRQEQGLVLRVKYVQGLNPADFSEA